MSEAIPPPDNDQNHEATDTFIIVVGSDDKEPDTGITYYVSEEGCYYYQHSGADQNIVSLSAEVNQEDGEIREEAQVLVDGDGYQTVTPMPSESSNREFNVLDVNKPVTEQNINAKERSNDNLYVVEDSDEELPNVKSSKRAHFNCHFCAYTSHRRKLLLRHIKSHSEDRPHKCPVCERGFKTRHSMQNHVNMHNGIKPYICKYCERPFTTSGDLVRHVRYRHTYEKPHTCSQCDYASVELSKLQRHMRCHTGERPYQCQHCTYASPDNFKLKRHLRTHTGEKPYKCDKCSKCFTQSNSLKAHKFIHNYAEKPVFACELCPAKCVRRNDLRIHVQKWHTSDTPIKCKRCGKILLDKYSYRLHKKTHVGEKCFKCAICPYSSNALRYLKSHLLNHSNKKPYVCDQCDTSFRQKQQLRRHQNLYHNCNYEPKPPKEKTHTCNECRRTFARKGNLVRHLSIHDPDSGHHEGATKTKLNDKIEESDNEGGMVNRDSSNEMERDELITVADGESQEYVVLEVIQLEDGSKQQVPVVAPDFIEEEQQGEKGKVVGEEEIEQYVYMQPNLKTEKESNKVEKDILWFDEDNEAGEEEFNHIEKVLLRLG